MSAEPQGSPPPDEAPRSQALTVVPMTPQAREIRVTTDAVPMLDTAKFEHMQRIATVMAESSLIPDSLRLGTELVIADDGTQTKRAVELPMRRITANCFMIVNQAVRWKMDPFAVAQCASMVHNKLMWEGKLVAAVIEANIGIRLKYRFTNDSETRKLDDQSLGVIVSGRFADEDEDRTIEGNVLRWHKGSKSPWGNPADWKRQLRYMGAREWARAHAPATMLGVLTDDEADENMHRRAEPTIPKKLKAPAPPVTTLKADAVAIETGQDTTAAPTAESKPVPIRGKAPPPPMKKKAETAEAETVEPEKQGDPMDKALKAAILKELANCESTEVIIALQQKHSAALMEMSADDREEIILEFQRARAGMEQ